MPIEPRDILESYFETGDIPTADQFRNLILSYAHLTDDDITVLPVGGTTQKNWGFGITTPQTRVGVKAGVGEYESVLSLYHADSDFANWFISLNPTTGDVPGFSIDQIIGSGQISQFFIEEGTGHVGIGTVTPSQKLSIVQSSSSGIAGIGLTNTANTVNQGWLIGEDQNSTQHLDGAFSIYVNSVSPGNKYFTILSDGNVGISQNEPDVKLCVYRDMSDPDSDLDLRVGTGNVVIGVPTSNVVMDRRGLQSRDGSYPDPANPDVLVYTAGNLNIQPLGGPVSFHNDMSIPVTSQAILTADASLGLGLTAPVEKLDVNGAIHLGTTTNSNAGTVRYTGTDFEGFTGGVWKSLTTGNGPWTEGTEAQIFYNTFSDTGRVGINTDVAKATLDVNDNEASGGSSIALRVSNKAHTGSTDLNSHRVGAGIVSTGVWGGVEDTKNIGLYVANVSGHIPIEANIAAVLNGNVLVGDLISGHQSFGTNAANVLSIQAGTAPGSTPDPTAIQIYSAAQSGGTTSVFYLRNGNGDVITLYKGAALPARDDTPITADYTSVEEDVINNLRSRLNAMEDALKAFGLLS